MTYTETSSHNKQQNTVKIKFDTRHDQIEGFYTLMTSGSSGYVSSNKQYFANEQQIKMLQEKGIKFTKLE
jgi:hypothetical protein